MRRTFASLTVLLGSALLGQTLAQTQEIGAAQLPPLPNPLTLEDALAFADTPHPTLELAGARLDRALAVRGEAEAMMGAQVSALGRVATVEPSDASTDRDNDNSNAQLALSKRLYDFGYSSANTRAAQLRLDALTLDYLEVRQQRRLEIMRLFLDVLRADLEYARDNEAMATAFVSIDKARDRNELGQVSDIDVMELEATYQKARRIRFNAAARQRATRARLALALNRPDDLPADLLAPPEPDIAQPQPEFEVLLAEVSEHNPGLKALRLELAAAQQALEAAEAADGPVVSAEAAASWWNRKTGSTHPLSAGLVLEMPLYTGGRRDAKRALARAALREARARMRQGELALHQAVLDLWLELNNLRIRMEEADVLGDYRELYLDRSRALYELEVRTDLGDAMVQSTAARLQRADITYQWILAKARLAALAGRLIDDDTAGQAREGNTP